MRAVKTEPVLLRASSDVRLAHHLDQAAPGSFLAFDNARDSTSDLSRSYRSAGGEGFRLTKS